MCEDVVATTTKHPYQISQKSIQSFPKWNTRADTTIRHSALLQDTQRAAITPPPIITTKHFAYTFQTAPVTFINCWLLTAPRVPQDRRSRPAVCLLHKTVKFCWFQTFAVFWMLYAFFWVIPRRLNTAPIHLWRWNRQCSETSAYKIQTLGIYPEESIQQQQSYWTTPYQPQRSLTTDDTGRLLTLKSPN